MESEIVCAEDDAVTTPSANDAVRSYCLENHIGFLLRRALQRHAAIFNDRMGGLDLTPTQFAALIKTVQFGRITQNHLGRQTAMDPATIQGVVRRLIERGFIRREDEPLDRRSAVLTPTPLAVAAVGEAVPAVRIIAEDTLKPLDEADRIQLSRLLARLG